MIEKLEIDDSMTFEDICSYYQLNYQDLQQDRDLARNPETNPETLEKLWWDNYPPEGDGYILELVAANPNISPILLKDIIVSAVWYTPVYGAALANPKTLEIFLEYEKRKL